MWSATESEFPRVIDPQLKWNISSNGKQRALRRARIFKQDNGNKSKDLKDTEEFFDKASSREGDMFVSESEKFGVSLLGRRFSENLESFPIKKRIISLLPSQSASHIPSSSSFHDHNQASYFPSFQNNHESLQQDETGVSPSHVNHEKESPDEKRSLTYIDEHVDDSIDFSGISILAAAACHSSIEKVLFDSDATVSGNSYEKCTNSLSCIEPHKCKDQLSNPELGINKLENLMVLSTKLNTHDEELGTMGSDEYKAEHSGSLHSSPNIRKLESSRDRRNWDLNTVMDVWENMSDDYSKCDTPSDVRSSWSHDMVCGNEESRPDEAGTGIEGVAVTASDKASISYSSCKLEEDIQEKHVSLVEDCDEGKHILIQTQVRQHLQGKCQFKDAELVPNVSRRISNVGNVENSCLISMNAYPVEGIPNLASNLSAKKSDLCEEDRFGNGCAKFTMKGNTHNTLPCPVIIGNTSHNIHVFDTFTEDKRANEMLHDESKSIATVDIYIDYSGECHSAYGKKGKSNQLWGPHVEKHQSSCTDVAFNVTKTSRDDQLDHNADGTVTAGDDEKQFRSSPKSTTAEGCLLDELLPSRIACVSHSEDSSTDVEMARSKSSILSCDILNSTKSSSPFHTYPELMNTVLEGLTLETKCIRAALISHGESQAPAGANANNFEKDSVEEHFHHDDPLNASLVVDHASRLEKVDLLGDDDSQYEDGELRESVLNSWGEDGAEEVETERVDYGSDCREADSYEAESDFCSQSDLAVGSTESKHEGRPITSCDGNRLRFAEDPPSKCSQTQFSVKDCSNVRYGEGDAKVDMLKDSGKVLDVNLDGEVPARAEVRFLASHLSIGIGDVSGKANQPSSSRMKSSGWDQLPRNIDAAAPLWNTNDASVASVINGESARTVSSIKREFSSRAETSKSSEPSCRKVVSYDRENRKNDHFDLHTQRSVDASRLNGRSRDIHSHGRGGVWVDPPDHHGSCRIAISGYYSSPKLPHPGSRNAAAAAVAKVESNGFVVAPDGTIIKGGNLGPGSHLSGPSSKSSSQFHSTRRGSPMENDGEFCMSSELSNSREGSPGRCFNPGRGRATKYGSRLFSLGHGNRYHSSIPDSRIGSQPLQHPSSRRQQSFSPHRKPVNLSHELSRSPSRSRTRSPHTWISPMGRNAGRIKDIPDAKRHSRSPTHFMPQRRILRQRSPPHRGFPSEEFAAYAPPSRNHSSPPHSSRWFDSDRICRDHLHEHQRRPRERSPPNRIFSQSNRLDNMDSHERIKPGDYYEPIYSEEYPVYGRGSKHDDCADGRRGRSNRYEMFHHDGNLKTTASMNCLHYDDEIGSHNLRPKSLVFQRRQSPRAFNRSFNAQNEDSPRRIKGEMVHFRHGRDAKPNTDFKPFKVRNTGDDLCLQRRPP